MSDKKDWPWPGAGKEFEDWFDAKYKWNFGTRWLKPIAKKFAAAGWDAGIINSLVENKEKIPGDKL